MRQFEKSPEVRRQKIAEKQNLNSRRDLRDKRYHVIDDEEDDHVFVMLDKPKKESK